jgi:hypothetical protein
MMGMRGSGPGVWRFAHPSPCLVARPSRAWRAEVQRSASSCSPPKSLQTCNRSRDFYIILLPDKLPCTASTGPVWPFWSFRSFWSFCFCHPTLADKIEARTLPTAPPSPRQASVLSTCWRARQTQCLTRGATFRAPQDRTELLPRRSTALAKRGVKKPTRHTKVLWKAWSISQQHNQHNQNNQNNQCVRQVAQAPNVTASHNRRKH